MHKKTLQKILIIYFVFCLCALQIAYPFQDKKYTFLKVLKRLWILGETHILLKRVILITYENLADQFSFFTPTYSLHKRKREKNSGWIKTFTI